jgi:hydrogenase maturation protease
LVGRPRPDGVDLLDVGIRGIHLAYQLLDGYEVLVIVDAAPRGRAPGTVTLIEVDQARIDDAAAEIAAGAAPMLDVHGLTPGAILRMLGSLGGSLERVLVLACEPANLTEGIGLSPAVAEAVEPAVAVLEELMDSHARRFRHSTEEVSR